MSRAISQIRYSSGKRNDRFMRGDLEYAVGRRIDNRPARSHVLFAEFFDNLRPRGRLVAERFAADARFERIHDFCWEAVRVDRKRLFEMNARHLPVARGGVLAGRSERTLSIRAGGLRVRR